jgi:dihydrofolate synthase/folylpolyglutamate synthase
MFHRIGAAAYKANLDNITALSNILGNPGNKFKSVHVAGTNGKGSVSNMLASIFTEAGYKTGLFTSPHLKDFRERIRIDGQMIGEESVVDFVTRYSNAFDEIQPSFFEWTTALAFQFFADEKADVAIIETGLGGRLDSTNIITPELSVITNISYDHMYLLGDTLTEIAGEKAGIIKRGIPVVVGERESETENVFIIKANESDAELTFASDTFSATKKSETGDGQIFEIRQDGKLYDAALAVGLKGLYQQKNICTVLQTFESLKEHFPKLSISALQHGVKNVKHNTGLRGRWDILNTSPLTIADIAHNESGIAYTVMQLNEILSARTGACLHIVFGMVSDKDAGHILQLLPENAKYYFCQPDLPRALDVNELAMMAGEYNLRGEKFASVNAAYTAARKNAANEDVIYIGGSTFVVAEVI